jgi:hypothetical protein
MIDEDDSDHMPIFGDDMNELMNSKSAYPMVPLLLFRQSKMNQTNKTKTFA